MDDLPCNYDIIIVGTGMIEALVAGAFSRVGKSVLHLDSNEYYGENWASFNLENIDDWIKNSRNYNNPDVEEPNKDMCSLIEGNETFVKIKKIWHAINVQKNDFVYSNIQEHRDQSFKHDENNDKLSSKDKISESSSQNKLYNVARKFNIDLSPKLLYSKGAMVELLISSNVAKYAEFKSFNRVLTWRNSQLEVVPCSRADVFSTKSVSVVQKRTLVKMLTFLANYLDNLHEFEGFESKSFLDFLKFKKVPDNLIHYILYAIAMGDETTSCLEGAKSCKTFLESLGRYGNSPFIFPMYGSGELPQCFCRLCAVFGGIYCLKREVEGLIFKDDECVSVVSNGIRLNAKNVILSSSYFLENYSMLENTLALSRGVFITNCSILKSEKDELTLLQFPPVPQYLHHPATIIELGSNTFTCPENYYLVHVTSKASETASVDLKYIIESLFQTQTNDATKSISKPQILWSLTWNFINGSCLKAGTFLKNVQICSGLDRGLDYDKAIFEAKKIFNEIYPEEEFLPRAPDPSEIILDFEEKIQESSHVLSDSKIENLHNINIDV